MTAESITLEIIGERTMHCGGCASAIQFGLGRLPGVQQVEANHRTQQIDLTFDAGTSDLDQLRRELDWIGSYQAVEVQEA